MNRRSFISSLLIGSVAPMFLKGSGRLWKVNYVHQPVDPAFWELATEVPNYVKCLNHPLSPWIHLIDLNEFPSGIGDCIRTTSYEPNIWHLFPKEKD